MKTILIYITASTQKDAVKMAKVLLQKKLISCANIIPKITSLYIWDNKIAQDEEAVLLCKTKANLYKKVVAMVSTIHTYDVPCIAQIPVQFNSPYLKWLSANLKWTWPLRFFVAMLQNRSNFFWCFLQRWVVWNNFFLIHCSIRF